MIIILYDYNLLSNKIATIKLTIFHPHKEACQTGQAVRQVVSTPGRMVYDVLATFPPAPLLVRQLTLEPVTLGNLDSGRVQIQAVKRLISS